MWLAHETFRWPLRPWCPGCAQLPVWRLPVFVASELHGRGAVAGQDFSGGLWWGLVGIVVYQLVMASDAEHRGAAGYRER